ncbi:ATP-binding protein [Ideonella aquatica]|uniref:ATP-binding protein n=1 Tax=Ideonella aquatica TaxID=2824119 RepID=UPI00287353BA|nr:ATP-binding protein [Ideonella aquatica]
MPSEVRGGWPTSMMGRLSLLLVGGVLVVQLALGALWNAQLRADRRAEAEAAAQVLGHGAAHTIRSLRSVPASYRPLVVQQQRDMGGARFLLWLNDAPVPVRPIAPAALAEQALGSLARTLHADLASLPGLQLAFSWPGEVQVSPAGARLVELPELWAQQLLLPQPAPVLLVQTELEPGHWLLLATLMPNPYFLDGSDAFSAERLLLPGISLAVALLLLMLFVLRGIIRPLAQLSDAATAIGRGEPMPVLPDTGSREFINTARAFRAMQQRIHNYLEDRERLFVAISHDLRTPITRLKLRSELLDDDTLRSEFEEDLDELDMMVKGALQNVSDSDIHEDVVDVRLDALISRLVRGAQLSGHAVAFTPAGLTVRAKPLALKRALGNLLDNALFYGERPEVSVHREGTEIEIAVRDHGPGVPDEALPRLFDPHLRLSQGREHNASGMGLGLGIARNLVQAQGGELLLANHPEGGFVARIRLPA